MITAEIIERYRSFRGRTGAVGRDAVVSLALARAEMRAEAEGLYAYAEPEQESYESVYGEAPPDGVTFYWIAIYRRDDVTIHGIVKPGRAGDWLASLGFVDDVDTRFWRETVAGLFAEALDVLDAERDREACDVAAELAGRPTFAGVAS